MRSTTVRLVWLVIVLAAVVFDAAGVCQAEPADDVQHFFDVVEATPAKGKSRLSIQQELFKATPAANATVPVRLAYGYALIHEKKYADALPIITAVAGEQQDAIAPHQAKAWLLLATQKPAEALAELEAIARVLATPAASPAAEKERAEVTAFLATALAYCDGPGASLVDKAAVTQVKSKVIPALSATQRGAFFQQATTVAKRYAELQAAHKAEEADGAKKGAAEDTAAAAAAKVEADRFAADVKKQYGQLTAEYARFNAAHDQLTNELSAAQNGLSKMQAKLASAKAPKKGKGTATSKEQVTGQINDSVKTLTATIEKLTASIAESTAKGKAIEDQIAYLRKDGQEVGVSLAELDKSIGKKKPKGQKTPRPVHNKTKAAKPSPATPAPDAPPPVEHEKAFVTYAEFPYQTAKERLLESLKSQ